MGTALTWEDPGEWVDKAPSHVPSVTIEAGKATISTEHVMSNAHYITHQYLRDQDGVLIGLVEHANDDEGATATSTLPSGTTQVTAYSYCNLHDLWISDALDV